MTNFQRYLIECFKYSLNRKLNFKILKWLLKFTFLLILLFLIVKLAGQFDWINIDWYLRMTYPNLYRLLSANIFHIFSISVTFCLFLYTYIGFKLSFKLLTLPLHIILLLGIKSVLQVWYNFIFYSYLIIGILEIIKCCKHRKSKKSFEYIKYLLCFLIIVYYHSWNFYNNEPLTNFVRTPDFIPSSLCDHSVNNGTNFDYVFQEFIKNHNKMMDKSTPVSERRAVVFRAYDGGLGNRLQGLLSSFLLAVLLKRAFFVDWSRNGKEAYASLYDLFEVNI
jgi:hypothetical protein